MEEINFSVNQIFFLNSPFPFSRHSTEGSLVDDSYSKALRVLLELKYVELYVQTDFFFFRKVFRLPLDSWNMKGYIGHTCRRLGPQWQWSCCLRSMVDC